MYIYKSVIAQRGSLDQLALNFNYSASIYILTYIPQCNLEIYDSHTSREFYRHVIYLLYYIVFFFSFFLSFFFTFTNSFTFTFYAEYVYEKETCVKSCFTIAFISCNRNFQFNVKRRDKFFCCI